MSTTRATDLGWLVPTKLLTLQVLLVAAFFLMSCPNAVTTFVISNPPRRSAFGITTLCTPIVSAQLWAAADENDDEESLVSSPASSPKVDGMEKAWRYVKKPLLSIGAKGASLSHGNSLRQLLEQHVAVKVKVNTRSFDGSLETAFVKLCSLAEENGAPQGIEMLQARESDKIIFFGKPGTRQLIQNGQFPPSP